MTNFAVVDLSSLFFRSRHGSAMDDIETRVGLGLHIIFRSLRKLYRELNVDHIVFAVDYGSWRRKVYPAYKSKRRLDRTKATAKDQEENQLYFDALNDLVKYLDEHTRCTVLRANGIEGDDFVAAWIAKHPQDEHIIVSGDSDFIQLIAPNVRIYDAINQRMIAYDKITDANNNRLEFSVNKKDGKIKIGKPDDVFVPEQDWWKKALFIKLIRGDISDSVFSAFPGVRYDGKKHSISGAWEDKYLQGYSWNNFMFQTWNKLMEDGSTKAVRVIDEFRINESIIDLTKQPEDIIMKMDTTIDEAITRMPPAGVGTYFLKFCRAHDLPSLEKETEHVIYLNSPYKTKTL